MSFSTLIFQHPANLIWLVAVPFLVVLFLGMLHWIRLKLNRFGQHELIKRITPENSVQKQYLKFFFLLAAFILIVVTLAGPKLSYRSPVNQPADLMIVLDVSSSMLAADIRPSRLQAAKTLAGGLSQEMENARMGLIPFAGQAILEQPLSQDKESFNLFLEQMHPESIPVQGTRIGPALKLASASFTGASDRARFILLLTDGENHDQEALEAASAIKAAGQHLIIYGLGSTGGSRIPVYVNGQQTGFKLDRSGKVIVSKFDSPFLDSLAEISQGTLLVAGIDEDAAILTLIEKKIAAGRIVYVQKVRDITFPFGLAAALLLLLAEFILSERKNSRINSFLKKIRLKPFIPVFFMLAMLIPAKSKAQVSYFWARKGNSAFKAGQYSVAENYYRNNMEEETAGLTGFNLASALYQQKKYALAASWFSRVIPGGDKTLRAQAWYGLGNCLFRQGKYAESIPAYIGSLRLNPGDQEALYNLAYARFMLKKSMPPPPQGAEPPPASSSQQQQQQQHKAGIDRSALKNELEKNSHKGITISQGLEQDW